MKRWLGIFVVAMGLAAPQANAAMIASDETQAGAERERVLEMVARPEVARELEKMGIAPQDAEGRVRAMSDAEVRYLAGRLDALPAGGVLSNQELLLIIVIVLLLIIIF